MARTTRANEIYPGAVCLYALADFDGDRLVLTDRGLQLAALPNPLLDGAIETAADTLSAEEREFFVSQVMSLVPGELSQFRVVVRAVAAGSNSPEGLFTAVRPQLPSEWSEVMARTHLSGVVARLAEMGVVSRRWEGRNVLYQLGGSASSLVEG